MRLRLLTAAMIVTSLAGGCPSNPQPTIIIVSDSEIAQTIVADAATPMSIAVARDGVVFYAEKETGRIRAIIDGVLQETPVADVDVNFAGDRGLLGLALHPAYLGNGRLYAFYSRSNSGADTDTATQIVDHRVVYFELAEDAGTGVLTATGAEVFVVSLPAGAEPFSVGGALAFAPDGTLYVATGQMGVPTAAQTVTRLEGKLLRYHDDGTIPDDNPIAGSAVYAVGLHEPRGLAFDPLSTQAFFIDLNAHLQSELNRVVAGANYGWPSVTGVTDTVEETAFVDATDTYSEPLLATGSGQERAFVGLAINDSGRYGPNRYGNLVYGERNTQRVLAAELDPLRQRVFREVEYLTNLPGPVTAVTVSSAGNLYVATTDAILKISPR